MTEHNEYSEDGILLVEGHFNGKGLKTGLWKEYYKSGSISTEEMFLDGKLHENYKSYHENGEIWCIGYYCHGNKEGRFEIHDPQGTLIFVQQYSNNKLISEVFFDKNKYQP